MPEAEFSEFTYGYAVIRETEDLLKSFGSPLTTAPGLPSLRKEKLVGYDAQLVTVSFSFFLQFKRSYFVSRRHRSSNCGIPNGVPHCTWAWWGAEHYRFDVDTRSSQFTAMRKHERDIENRRYSGLSAYVAPVFHRERELNEAYLNNRIIKRSVGIAPSAFDRVTVDKHRFSFLPSLSSGVVTSDPIPTSPTRLRHKIEAATQATPTEHPTLASYAASTAEHARQLGLPVEFDQGSASDTLRFLQDYALQLDSFLLLYGQAD